MKFFINTNILIFLCFTVAIHSQSHPGKPIGTEVKIPSRAIQSRAISTGFEGLRAVILVGDVDGDMGSGTRNYIRNMKELAKFLKSMGVRVDEFYSPDTPWDEIKEKSNGAHFILYSGHGVGSTLDAPYIQKKVGGFAFKNQYISPEKIESELKPHAGAVIILAGACFSAGNMSYDMGKIDYEEARKRVIQYSESFRSSGFSGYYATWSHTSAKNILLSLLTGKSHAQSYQLSEDTQNVHEESADNATVWINEKPYQQKSIFNYAFAGKPEVTLTTVFAENKKGETSGNIENKDADKRLIHASFKGDVKSGSAAIALGANVNTTHDGWTPLMLAAYYGHSDFVDLLLKNKADINKEMKGGWTALRFAERRNFPDIAAKLKEAGATVASGSRSMAGELPKPEK